MEVSEERGCVDEDAARRVVFKIWSKSTIREDEDEEMAMKSWHAPPEVC